MDGTVFQRIKEYIDTNQISLNSLAKTLSMNQSTVLRQVKGEQTLSSNLVEAFLTAYPDVSAEWLMRGIGNMSVCKYAEHFDDSINISMVADSIHDYRDAAAHSKDSVWKTKYETIKECYDSLLASLSGIMGKRDVG